MKPMSAENQEKDVNELGEPVSNVLGFPYTKRTASVDDCPDCVVEASGNHALLMKLGSTSLHTSDKASSYPNSLGTPHKIGSELEKGLRGQSSST
jgi:hypothetical protein